MSNIASIARNNIRVRRIFSWCILSPFLTISTGAFILLSLHAQWLFALLFLLFGAPLWIAMIAWDRWARSWVVDIEVQDNEFLLFRCYNQTEFLISRTQVKQIRQTWDYYVFFLDDNRKLWFFRRKFWGFLSHPLVDIRYFPYTEFI